MGRVSSQVWLPNLDDRRRLEERSKVFEWVSGLLAPDPFNLSINFTSMLHELIELSAFETRVQRIRRSRNSQRQRGFQVEAGETQPSDFFICARAICIISRGPVWDAKSTHELRSTSIPYIFIWKRWSSNSLSLFSSLMPAALSH